MHDLKNKIKVILATTTSQKKKTYYQMRLQSRKK